MRILKRKLVSVVLVVLTILTLSVTAFAAETSELRISGTCRDGRAVVKAYLTAEGTTNGRVKLEYDPEIFALVEVLPGDSKWIYSVNTKTAGEVYFAWAASNFPAEEDLLVSLVLKRTAKQEMIVSASAVELYDSGKRLPLPEPVDTIVTIVEIITPVNPEMPDIPTPGQPTLPEDIDPVDPTDNPFTDIDNHWAEADILKAYYAGMVNGTGNGKFSPDMSLDRGMFATLLYRLAGAPEVTGSHPFTDVAEGMYYSDAVLWAYQNGVVNGTSATTFAPSATLTREQMVTMLYRYANWAGMDTSDSADLSVFSDSANVSGYAVTAMKWAVAENIIKGQAGALVPANTTTRAQAATVLVRFAN